MSTFVVFGARGFLGASVVNVLQQQGHNVVTPDVRLEDIEQVRRVLKQQTPCNVICATGVSGRPTTQWSEDHPSETCYQNITLPLMLAEECRAANCHLTILGSGLVCSETTNYVEHREDDFQPIPERVYDRMRFELERTLDSVGYEHVLLLRILYPVLDATHAACFGTKMLRRSGSVNPDTVSITVLPSLLPFLADLILNKRFGAVNFVNRNPVYLPDFVRRLGADVVQVNPRNHVHRVLATDKLEEWIGQPVPQVGDALAGIVVRKVWYAPNAFEAYGEQEIQAVINCLRDGILAAHGPQTARFEHIVTAHFGKRFGLFVNSGSSANLLALKSLQLPPNSHVVTPACTFATTVAPIIQCGYTPVFCDVQQDSYVPSVKQVLAAMTHNTRAIMLPNLIGSKPDWKTLKQELLNLGRPDVWLIEDSCDAMTFTHDSDIATTSFYASHMITAAGSGGMVMFNHDTHFKHATMARDWGRIGNNVEDINERFNYNVDGIPYDWKFLYGTMGYNFKPTEMQAAFGLVQLERLHEFQDIRRRNFERYLERLQDLKHALILPRDTPDTNWLAMPLQVVNGKRQELLEFLEANRVQTRVCFSGNITKHPAFLAFKDEFAVADTIMATGFLLGCHHGMNIHDVDRVCDLLHQFVENKNE